MANCVAAESGGFYFSFGFVSSFLLCFSCVLPLSMSFVVLPLFLGSCFQVRLSGVGITSRMKTKKTQVLNGGKKMLGATNRKSKIRENTRRRIIILKKQKYTIEKQK